MLILPDAMIAVVRPFAQAFTERTWEWVQILVVGAIVTPSRRTVTARTADGVQIDNWIAGLKIGGGEKVTRETAYRFNEPFQPWVGVPPGDAVRLADRYKPGKSGREVINVAGKDYEGYGRFVGRLSRLMTNALHETVKVE